MRAPLACFLSCIAATSVARADTEACIAGAEDGQKLRDEGHLVEARARLAACGQEDCPAAVRADCLRFIADVERRTPSIVLGATWRGKDTTEVTATVDGTRTISTLDTRPIELDPGEHRVRFERAGDPPVEQTLVLREGEKERPVRVQFEPPVAPRPVPLLVRKPPSLAYAMTATSVASAAVFIGLGIAGFVTYQVCANQGAACDKPSHEAQSLTEFVFADIGLGVALVTAGIATWAFIRHARRPANAATLIPFRFEF